MAIMAPDDLNSVALSLCLQIIGSAVQHPGMSMNACLGADLYNYITIVLPLLSRTILAVLRKFEIKPMYCKSLQTCLSCAPPPTPLLQQWYITVSLFCIFFPRSHLKDAYKTVRLTWLSAPRDFISTALRSNHGLDWGVTTYMKDCVTQADSWPSSLWLPW